MQTQTANDRSLSPRKIALLGRTIRLMLVYQAGIANVFQVDSFNRGTFGRNARRVYQGDFRTAESICYGAGLAGASVRSAACNMAGDIALQTWSADLDAHPFSESFHVQVWN